MFSANQKPFVIFTHVTSFALVLQVCTGVQEELHSFLSQSELSTFFERDFHKPMRFALIALVYWDAVYVNVNCVVI